MGKEDAPRGADRTDASCWVEQLTAGRPLWHDPGTTLILAAHPDDESAGVGGRIHRLGEVWIAMLTDGAPRDPWFAHAAGQACREGYAELRYRELLRAMAVAGLPAERAISLGCVADQEATSWLVELVHALERVLDERNVSLVVTHAYEGGHPDHDAAAFVARAAIARKARRQAEPPPALVEMAGYHDQNGRMVAGSYLPGSGHRGQTAHLTARERARKCAMLECHRSQRAVLERFPRARERYRPAPQYCFGDPPHRGLLHYERFGWDMTSASFRALARGAAVELSVPELVNE